MVCRAVDVFGRRRSSVALGCATHLFFRFNLRHDEHSLQRCQAQDIDHLVKKVKGFEDNDKLETEMDNLSKDIGTKFGPFQVRVDAMKELTAKLDDVKSTLRAPSRVLLRSTTTRLSLRHTS